MSSFLLSQQHIHTGFTFLYNKCIHTYMYVPNKNTFLHFFKITNISHLFRCFLGEKIRNVCTSDVDTLIYKNMPTEGIADWHKGDKLILSDDGTRDVNSDWGMAE